MRLGPLRTCVMILRGEDPLTPPSDDEKEKALAYLKEATGQDFGFDGDKWEAWLKDNRAKEYF